MTIREEKDLMIYRSNKDGIGLPYMDRHPCSCRHKTMFCQLFCYYKKFMRYPNVRNYLIKAERAFQSALPSSFEGVGPRFRFCKVGDPLAATQDFMRLAAIADGNPATIFWLPTRAWRDPELLMLIPHMPDNCRVMCSIDPSNTQEEIDGLVGMGLSTMFFGNDEQSPVQGSFKCPKTWEHVKNHCRTCEQGCFAAEQKHVWLKKH